MEKQKESYPYRKARLVEAKGRWYVIFYVWNENLNNGIGGLDRKRTYDINKYPDLEIRRSAGEALVDNINAMLKAGYCIRKDIPADRFKSKIDINNFTLRAAIEQHVENNKNVLSPNTLKWYLTLQNALYPWLYANGIYDIRLIDFSLEMANSFFTYLKNDKLSPDETKKGVSNKTWNNYHTTLNAVFNAYVDQELIKKKKNVLRKIKKKRSQTGKHIPYSHEQLQQMHDLLETRGENQLLLFIQFVYYTFTRPGTETRLLRVQDIKENTIFISAESSKGDRGEHISIPPGLEKLIQEHKLRDYPPEYYIFTRYKKPGLKPVGEHYFWKRHRKYLDELNFTDKEYTLYGYKHTGNIMLYLAGADPIAVQRHNRHTSLDQTLKYLRDLGMIRNEDVITKFPDFRIEAKELEEVAENAKSGQLVPALTEV